MDIATALDRFLMQLAADGRSAHTRAQYRRHVRLLANGLPQSRIEQITHEELARFLVSSAARIRHGGGQKKATTTNALRTSIRVFFGFCAAAGYTSQNPARLIRRARCGSPPPRALSKDEERRLLRTLGQASDRDRTLFGLMLRTGIRLGSAIALDVADVDLSRREIRLRRAKGDREQVVYVPKCVCRQLRKWIGRRTSGPLFPARHGGTVSARHASRVFQGLLAAAGIGRVRGTHVLRHSFAVRVLDQTGDIFAVKECLGHRGIASSLVYLEGRRRRARRALLEA